MDSHLTFKSICIYCMNLYRIPNIFNKQLFYILNNAGDVEFTIQTEYSPISVEMGGAKYILCGSQGGTHFNYGIGFNDDMKYSNLKATVIKILEKKYKQEEKTERQ